jgi:hypothetical protein
MMDIQNEINSILFYSIYSILFYCIQHREGALLPPNKVGPLRPIPSLRSTFKSVTCVFFHRSVTIESKVPVPYKMCTALL